MLLGYRRFQLGLEFDRPLFREMQRFGLPLVPSGLALWALDFTDRFLLLRLGRGRGRALLGRRAGLDRDPPLADRAPHRLAGVRLLDHRRREAKRAYGFVLTYVLYITCWMSLALSLLAPWIVRLLAAPAF